MSKKVHYDNYNESKMRRNVIRSLQCFNDIITDLNKVTDYINHSGLPEYDKEITFRKAYFYSSTYDKIKKYFPERLDEVLENDSIDE